MLSILNFFMCFYYFSTQPLIGQFLLRQTLIKTKYILLTLLTYYSYSALSPLFFLGHFENYFLMRFDCTL